MNFKLKKVNFIDAMTEETPCFTAEIWEGHKKVAHVSNQGHGGANMVVPVEGLTYQDIEKYDNIDVEADIFGMVYDADFLKKNQSKCLVLRKDDKTYTQKLPMSISKLKKHKDFPKWRRDTFEGIIKDGYTILNKNL